MQDSWIVTKIRTEVDVSLTTVHGLPSLQEWLNESIEEDVRELQIVALREGPPSHQQRESQQPPRKHRRTASLPG